MLLGEILHRAVIKTDLEASTKDAAIAELIDLLIDAKDLTPNLREPVLHALYARERSMSTGMEMGIALPHGTSPGIPNLVGALGISAAGIDWQCLDDQPARLIMLLVLPRHEFQVHVRTLAGISHLLNGESFRNALINAPNADTILKLIRKEETGSIFDGFRKRFK